MLLICLLIQAQDKQGTSRKEMQEREKEEEQRATRTPGNNVSWKLQQEEAQKKTVSLYRRGKSTPAE